MQRLIGNDLKTARLNKGFSIEEISKKTNIRKNYLIAMEEDDYDSLPGMAYTKGYQKIYSNFLKIDVPSQFLQQERQLKAQKYKKILDYLYHYKLLLLFIIITVSGLITIALLFMTKNSSRQTSLLEELEIQMTKENLTNEKDIELFLKYNIIMESTILHDNSFHKKNLKRDSVRKLYYLGLYDYSP